MAALSGLNPVLLKELRVASRRGQIYVGRGLFIVLTAYLIFEYWKESWGAASGRAALSLSAYADFGRAIFSRCDRVAEILTVLAAAIAGSDIISREMKSGTLGLLLLTPMSAGNVVRGKWVSVFLTVLSLYLSSVPVLAVAVYLGGVGAEDLVRSTAWTLSLAAVAGAVSIYQSAKQKSGGTALAATVATLVLVLAVFHVVDSFAWAITRNRVPGQVPPHRGGLSTLLLAAALTTGYLKEAIGWVHRQAGGTRTPLEQASDRRALERGLRSGPPVRILRGWRAVWDANPLLWKEYTLRPVLRLREDWRTRAIIGLFALLLTTWVASLGVMTDFFLKTWGAFFAVVGLASGSLLFAPEKEHRQWQLLLSTPITSAQVVRAKLLCGLIYPEAVGMIALYLLALLLWLGGQVVTIFLALGAVSTLFILFSYLLAASASLRASTARGAFLFGAGVVSVLVTLPSMILTAVRTVSPSGALGGSGGWEWLEALDPLSVAASFQMGTGFGYRHYFSSRAMGLVARFFAVYLPLSIALTYEMVWRFRRIAQEA